MIIDAVFVPGPNAITDSILFGQDCNTSSSVAYSDDEGVGLASRISSNIVCQVIVSPYVTSGYSSSGGDIKIIVNDRWDSDQDLDGLGTGLENALQTCDDSSTLYTMPNGDYRSCTHVFKLHDTDRDGLNDYEETYGVEMNGSAPLYLPKWGANPAQKDLFIEIDYQSPHNQNLITVATLRKIQQYFSQGSSNSLRNFNGQDGVRVHFDVGRDPALGSPTSDYTLFGDWGGSQIIDWAVTAAQLGLDPDKEWYKTSESVIYFQEVRRNRFRWLFRRPGGTSCQGIVRGERKDTLNVYSDSNCPKTMAHEIGHSAMLNHWGISAWGPSINCKPNYASIMNYAYILQNENTPIDGENPGFSRDIFSNSLKLNPASVLETDGLRSNYGISNPPEFLGTKFLFNFLFQNSSSCGSYCDVDWNRDGTYSSATVRAGASISPHCIDASVKNPQELETVNIPQSNPPTSTFAGSPVLIRYNNYFYIIYLNQNGEIRHRVAEVRLDGLYGSCDDDMDVLKTYEYEQILGKTISCLQWKNGTTFESDVNSIDAIEYNGKILITYTKTESGNRKLYSRILSGGIQSDGVIPVTSWSQAITRSLGPYLFQGTGGMTTPPSIETTPKLVKMSVNPNNFSGENVVIGLFYIDRATDPGENKWYWFNQTNETWSSSPINLQNVSGSNIVGYIPPAFVMWPGANSLSESRTCGLISDADNRGDFYCFIYATEKWEKMTDIVFDVPNGGRPYLLSQAEIVFHRQRKTNGSPVSNDDTKGQFWLSYQSNGPSRYVLYRSKTISGSNWPFTSHFSSSNTMFDRSSWSHTMNASDGKKLSLYEDSLISGVKAVLIQRKSSNEDTLTFLPFFDNTYRTLDTHLATGNDFRVMERGICWGLHVRTFTGLNGPYDASKANSFCGASGNSFWGY